MAYFRSSAALACVLACASFNPASAQTADDSANSGIAEIIVTAEKRSTNVQDVPISITAISADELQNNNVIGTRGLSGLAPNVTLVRMRAG